MTTTDVVTSVYAGVAPTAAGEPHPREVHVRAWIVEAVVLGLTGM
ncbi:hypothetical protein V5P93_003900 [Actinokineospora auranticolor]|uniref:Uncharacterized protein n=1 Tax=Actinokineospora auranticolor TaxID=155976 RepID=A0A2S6GLT8_9PSEU|nr:hypothetical protein [Actinokineospora auranticolor]PPK66185.1 hypothetical protein CLV40_111149 [Actinokineospora auranticolor]